MSATIERPAARRISCPRCGDDVVEAPLRGGGLTVLLEPKEVLQQWRCPECLSARQRDRDVVCWRCGYCVDCGMTALAWNRTERMQLCTGGRAHRWHDARVVGDPISGFGAAVAEDGLARPVDLARVGLLRAGEALHRAHRCSVRAAA